MKIDSFGLIVKLWMSVVLSAVLSVLLPLISMGFVNWPIFIVGFAVSFVISLEASLIIPINALGGGQARWHM
jgi:predicted lysophospholipase L1 biosynthesis ABC-type transport system permease subunit